MTIAEILRAGKAAIERRGWARGEGPTPPSFDENGVCCVLTAIAGDAKDYNDATIRLFERANGIKHLYGVIAWNDDPARTKEEVLTAFDKAIALAEQENT